MTGVVTPSVVEQVVAQRYSAGAQEVQPALCCPVVGPIGRVIGVDLNDDMLALVRGAAPAVAERVGYRALKRDSAPWRVVEWIEFRAVTVVADKGAERSLSVPPGHR